MPTGAFKLYDCFAESLLTGSLDLFGDAPKVALFTTHYQPNPDEDLSYELLHGEVREGNGYVRGGKSLPNLKMFREDSRVTLHADDVSWLASGDGFSASHAVIYSPTPGINLIGFCRLSQSRDKLRVQKGKSLVLRWGSNGILSVKVHEESTP